MAMKMPQRASKNRVKINCKSEKLRKTHFIASTCRHWCLQQALNLTQITLRAVFVVELVKSSDFGTTEANTAIILIRCVLELMDGGYFEFISGTNYGRI